MKTIKLINNGSGFDCEDCYYLSGPNGDECKKTRIDDCCDVDCIYIETEEGGEK